MVSLKDAVLAANKKPVRGCAVSEAARQLNRADRLALLDLLEDREVMGSAIRKGLESHAGISLGKSVVQRHRAAECTCDVDALRKLK